MKLSKTIKILLYGLEKSGKSTIINSFQEGHFTSGTPFTAQNITEIILNGIKKFDIVEVGGRKEVRRFVTELMDYVNAIIFVIDGSDERSFPEVKYEFEKIISNPKSLNKPLVILFHKKDIAHVHPSTIIEQLNILDRYDRPHRIFSTSAKEPNDFSHVLNWIYERLVEDEFQIEDRLSRFLTICILDMLNEEKSGLPLLSILGQLEIISHTGQIEYDRDKIISHLRKLQDSDEIEFVSSSQVWKISRKGREKLMSSELFKAGKYEKLRDILNDDLKGSNHVKNEREILEEYNLDELAELYKKTKQKK